ncbi:polyketide synthase family protein [Striga asiatica]|uniref:Polyketide synthase family protein n=1 Tax=Striga asiatica TaxID=4170 RepID=A0A5A7PMA6_STRAF|nr:polyketide synthase family protein [Striga asiatica]
MTKESNILDAFENIHQACLTEIDPNLTLKECVVTFMVLKESTGEHYFNNPEPMWDTLTRTFADLSLNNYPGKEFWKRHPDFPTFDQLIADYWAEEARQTARRRRR